MNGFRRAVSKIGKRANEKFLEQYNSLDMACREKFGVPSGGVTEYINRLNNARYAPGREDVLPRLVRYRNLRNRMAHEVGSLRRSSDISKEDIKWVHGFLRAVNRSKDPISIYLRKARRYARRRRLKRYAIAAAVLILIAAGIVAYFMLRK